MQRRSTARTDSRYKQIRERNNLSVKKSRDKSRRERQETVQSIRSLETENQKLAEELKGIKDEYEQLRDLFKQYTGMDLDPVTATTTATPTKCPTPPAQLQNETSEKPVINIRTTEDASGDKMGLDATNLDGSIVVINGVQYKIVSMNN